MAKTRIVHYLNNFFAGIGGEEQAGIGPEIREEVLGPGLAIKTAFGEEYDIVATAICGDNYFGENLKEAVAQLIALIKPYQPDIFIAGPAFNAGRYGVACGTIAKAVEEQLGIPVLTAMYPENPGVDMFKKDLYIVETKISASDMRRVVPIMKNLSDKLVHGTEILSPSEEHYIERGIRVNYFAEKRGSERAVDLIVRKCAGEKVPTEYPMPAFDRVEAAPELKDLKNAKIAVVTSGGIVPQGNPEHIESSSATKFGMYTMEGMDSLLAADYMTVHGGYDRQFVTENPNLVVPLDVLRDMEKEGVFKQLYNFFFTTTGTGTATSNSKRFGEEIAKKLLDEHIDAVILTST